MYIYVCVRNVCEPTVTLTLDFLVSFYFCPWWKVYHERSINSFSFARFELIIHELLYLSQRSFTLKFYSIFILNIRADPFSFQKYFTALLY